MELEKVTKLKEYITLRNQAFESKQLNTENPLPRQHFCNNQKYLDAYSQDIIHGNMELYYQGYDTSDMLYNTLIHRVLLDKDTVKELSDEHGIFYSEDFDTLCNNLEGKKFTGRYRNMMQNRFLAKMSPGDFLRKIVESILPELEKFQDCKQSDIWKDGDLRRNGYQCGAFTQYQLSSDLLYIPTMNIIPDYIDYCNLGTSRGIHYLTGKWDYDQEIIDLILDINDNYDHKTEFTKYMIPSDANNVLCEFYKYTVSRKKRYRKPEVITHKSGSIKIPKNIRRYRDGS